MGDRQGQCIIHREGVCGMLVADRHHQRQNRHIMLGWRTFKRTRIGIKRQPCR